MSKKQEKTRVSVSYAEDFEWPNKEFYLVLEEARIGSSQFHKSTFYVKMKKKGIKKNKPMAWLDKCYI